MMRTAVAAAVLLAAAPLSAEIVASTPGGFHLRATATAAAPPDKVWALLVQPALWWSSSHSYSGDAKNISIAAVPGGCWCESLPGGGAVEHGRIVYLQPGKALRANAALGPLQAEGVVGALTWSLKAVPGGTEITQTYVVGGYMRSSPASLAAPVDGVMTEALTRLAAAAGK